MKIMAKGSDGKFHEVEVLGIVPSPFHLFPLAYVMARRGCPFNDSRFCEIEYRSSLIFYVGNNDHVLDADIQRKTTGL